MVLPKKPLIAAAFLSVMGTTMLPAEQPPEAHEEYVARPKRILSSYLVVTCEMADLATFQRLFPPASPSMLPLRSSRIITLGST